MTEGEGEIAVPRPRRAVRLVGPSAPSDAVTTRSPGRSRSATAVLDTVAPPWLRVPDGASDALSRPADPRGAVRRTAVHPPVVLRAVAGGAAPRPGPPANPTRPPAPPHPARARPPVVPEPGILGLSRLTRGRVGSRLFTLCFVAVFAVILVQMLMAILYG